MQGLGLTPGDLQGLQPDMIFTAYARAPANSQGCVDEGALMWNSRVYSGKVILVSTLIAGAKINQADPGPYLSQR